ncbi:hypothetical protein [Methanobrevibacter sp.]|uniref:hypothetical protein n=1 Tax=Methanobrevibacter sp. TaxID=66852 RepID=UPI00386B4E4F
MSGKKHILILLLSLTITLIALSVVSAVDLNSTDADGYDDSIANIDEAVLSSNSKTFKDLNHDINGNMKSKIYLNSDYTFNSKTDSSFDEGIKINRKVTIDGKGHTLDGNGEARIFMVKNKNVIFKNIIFINGNADYGGNEINGGAIFGYSTCINCTFKDNYAVNAGAMHNGTARDCTFIHNGASYWGGAMYYGSVYNCTFIDNYADYGGALWYCFACENSYFESNFASLDGGAVNTAPVVNCRFIDNYAKYGGAVFMYLHYDFEDTKNSVFINNSAEYGGAIYVDRYGAFDDDDYAAVDCNFQNNKADYGGALYDTDAANSNFKNNSAKIKGGAIYKGVICNCKFSNNYVNSTKNNYYNTKTLPPSKLSSNKVNALYKSKKYLVVKLTDSKGKVIKNARISIQITASDVWNLYTDSNGKVKVSTKYLLPNTYYATIEYLGNSKIFKSTIVSKIVIKKLTPKLVANKKTFNAKDSKKYSVSLKDYNNKALKNKKVSVVVDGKTYSAKTNKYGKATLTLSKLTKKGTYSAKVKFGDKYYKTVTKTVKIYVK